MEIIAGDDNYIKVSLTKSGLPFIISSGATVTACVMDASRRMALTDIMPLDINEVGANWTSSIVVVKVPSSLSSKIRYATTAVLEVQVAELGMKSSWFATINIVKGLI